MAVHKGDNRQRENWTNREQYKPITNISRNVTKTVATLSKLFSNLSTRLAQGLLGSSASKYY